MADFGLEPSGEVAPPHRRPAGRTNQAQAIATVPGTLNEKLQLSKMHQKDIRNVSMFHSVPHEISL